MWQRVKHWLDVAWVVRVWVIVGALGVVVAADLVKAAFT